MRYDRGLTAFFQGHGRAKYLSKSLHPIAELNIVKRRVLVASGHLECQNWLDVLPHGASLWRGFERFRRPGGPQRP